MRAEAPPDPRAAGIRALRKHMPLPEPDAETRDERRLLHRIDLKDALK